MTPCRPPLQRRTSFPRFPRLVKCDFERSPAEHTNMRIFVHTPALIITQNFAHQRYIRETSLSLSTVFHTAAALRAACCRTFPDGLFSLYCSRPRGCASSTTSSSIYFNINGSTLSPTPRGSADCLARQQQEWLQQRCFLLQAAVANLK